MPESVDDAIALLSRPMPDATQLAAALGRLRIGGGLATLPEPRTQAEDDLFDALTVIFVEPARSGSAREAVRAAVGDQMFEMLAAYLAFVRTAHFWTETHPELAFEPDMLNLMEQRSDLQDMLLSPADAERVRAGGDLRRVLAELQQTEAALRESETRFRVLADNISQLAWTCDSLGNVNWYNRRWLEYTGLSFGEMKSWGWEKVQHPDHLEQVVASVELAGASGEPWEATFPLRRHDGEYRWFYSQAVPLRDQRGVIVQWFGTNTDITEQRQAAEALRNSEERLRLLVAELQHRVRNILTVVRLTFSRTAEGDGDKEELVQHFKGRLDAMARTQVALTRHADRTANLEDMIRDELMSVGVHADGGPVTLAGPEVELGHKTAESLAMALHELTTNALKYGALSVASANLDVTWQLNIGEGNERSLDLVWAEQGVPAIAVRPARRGFGRELIEEALPYRLGAETRLEFRGGGVRCAISIPLGTESGAALP